MQEFRSWCMRIGTLVLATPLAVAFPASAESLLQDNDVTAQPGASHNSLDRAARGAAGFDTAESSLRPALLIARDDDAADVGRGAPHPPSRLEGLVVEALEMNPEIRAAQWERDAAKQRIRPAGALDDPMLEAGVITLPVPSWSFRREDMTMKMLGLLQKLPFPGKRGLREDVASKQAEVVAYGYQETVNRVVRDVKATYFDLSLVAESTRLVQKNKQILDELLKITQARYGVGQGSQADVLKAQTQLSRMVDELIKLGREQSAMEAELARAIGRRFETLPPPEEMPAPQEITFSTESLYQTALKQRPQLLGLETAIAKATGMLDLARKDYYPDFDVRVQYGQRDRMPDGQQRENMVTFTVGMNLPVWRQSKLDPRVAEAEALRDQATNMYQSQQNEIAAKLRQQVAGAEQSLKSAQLYRTTILPQARLTVEASLAAFRVNRVDFLTLLDSQMAVFNYEIAYAQAVAGHNKSLAEIDFLVGKPVPEARPVRP